LTNRISNNRIIHEIEKEGYMNFRILSLVGVCLLLFIIGGIHSSCANTASLAREDTEIPELKEKQKYNMKDISEIATALADYITDNGVLPKQDGTYDENSEFYKALSPFYVRVLPIEDTWGNNYRVYCGEACNGKYGISRCGAEDFVVVSYGRDGKKEDFEFDSSDPGAGIYYLESVDDFDKDLIMWNGSWVRAPRPKRQ
jgi:uncharacterized protein YozE (UPF0346 family)